MTMTQSHELPDQVFVTVVHSPRFLAHHVQYAFVVLSVL